MDNGIKIPDCPAEMTLRLIGDKWKVLIIGICSQGQNGSTSSCGPSAA